MFGAAQIVDGKLWFQLDCGSGPGILGISGRAVNDGSWHSVFLELNRNFTSLSLDDSYVERRRAPLYFQTLSTESTIYFGALVQADNIRSLTDTRVTQVLSGFQGCLDSVVLKNNELPLQNKRSSFAEVVGLTELKLGCVLYPDACERSPCQHGGSCTGLPSGGECTCALGTPALPGLRGRDKAGRARGRPAGGLALTSLTIPRALLESCIHPCCWPSLLPNPLRGWSQSWTVTGVSRLANPFAESHRRSVLATGAQRGYQGCLRSGLSTPVQASAAWRNRIPF